MSATKPGAVNRPAIMFVPERDPTYYNPAGVPRLSDEDHFNRALGTVAPHTYVAERAGRLSFKGEDGIGFYNAQTLHIRIFRQHGKSNDMSDITNAARLSPSFAAAVEWVSRHETAIYARLSNMLPAVMLPATQEYHLR